MSDLFFVIFLLTISKRNYTKAYRQQNLMDFLI